MLKAEELDQIPETRQLVEAANGYVAGTADYMLFYCLAQSCAHLARIRGVAGSLRDFLLEWERAAERCRDEWGDHDPNWNREDLRRYLAAELAAG